MTGTDQQSGGGSQLLLVALYVFGGGALMMGVFSHLSAEGYPRAYVYPVAGSVPFVLLPVMWLFDELLRGDLLAV